MDENTNFGFWIFDFRFSGALIEILERCNLNSMRVLSTSTNLRNSKIENPKLIWCEVFILDLF